MSAKIGLTVWLFLMTLNAFAVVRNDKCNVDPESLFFRQMTEQYIKFTTQTGLTNLPYSTKDLAELIKKTCVKTSEAPLIIEGESKDAINLYPEQKVIWLYKSTWEKYRKKFETSEWNIEDYYQIFLNIHHEVIPYFKRKSDPTYQYSLDFYNYFKPPPSVAWNHAGEWIYVQKTETPGVGHYLGSNCAILVTIPQERIRDDQHDDFLWITLGLQNPLSHIECPDTLSIYLSSFLQGDLKNFPIGFTINCKEEGDIYDFKRRGEFKKYSRKRCWSYHNDENYAYDKNLMAFLKLEVEFLPEKELKITYNFYRGTWDNVIFSFSNIYKPLKEVKKKNKSIPSNLELSEYFNLNTTQFPIQKWILANKFQTVEENCNAAKEYIKIHVDQSCNEWLRYYKFDEDEWGDSTLGRSRRFLFSKNTKAKNLFCDESSFKFWKIEFKKDNACLIVGEKMILNKLNNP